MKLGRRLAAAGLLVGLLIALGYLAWSNWRLTSWLRSAAASAGCNLEYATAYTVLPGRFHLGQVELTGCGDGSWSGRVEDLRGQFDLASLFSGPLVIEAGRARVRDIRAGSFSADGVLEVTWRELALSRPLAVETVKAKASAIVLRGTSWTLRTERGLRAELHENGAERVLRVHGQDLAGTFRGILLRATQVLAVAQLRLAPPGQGLILGPGEILPQELVIDGHPLESSFTLQRARLGGSLELDGRLSLAGENAALLLDWLNAPDAVRLTLSVLEQESFELSALLQRRRGRIRLERLAFTSGALSASGWVTWEAGDPAHGNLRLDYGGVPFDLQLTPDGAQLELRRSDLMW